MSYRAPQYNLHYGSAKHPVAEVVPDKTWPGMWRVRCDDQLSDMANLSRAKDAAMAIAERGPPGRDRLRLSWKFEPIEEALGGRVVSQNSPDHVEPA